MNFCENCNIACKDERCPKCGRKKLRTVNADDFCLISQVDRFFGDSLKVVLENENIECVLVPHGTGVNSNSGLPLENYLLFVRYKNTDRVLKILNDENY